MADFGTLMQIRRSEGRREAAAPEGRLQRHGRRGTFLNDNKKKIVIIKAFFCLLISLVWMQAEKKRKRKMQEKEGKSKKRDFKF